MGQASKVDSELNGLKLTEVEKKISSITYTDLQSTMTDLNLVRKSLDEQIEHMIKNCQSSNDKNKINECVELTRSELKKLWSQYFSAKEKYLNLLHQYFKDENSKQAKVTLDFIDSLHSVKPKK